MPSSTWVASPLGGEAAWPCLEGRLAPLAERFSGPEAFAWWRVGLREALASGQAQVLAAGPEGAPAEAWALVQVGQGPWVPLALLGEVGPPALLAWWAWWRAHAPALVWDDELGGPELLAHWEGAKAYQRHLAHQDLARVPPRPLAAGLRPLRSEDAAAAAALIAQAHPGDRLDELFLAHPGLPTPQGVADAIAAIWPAALAHPASGLAEGPGGLALGVVLVVPGEAPGAGLLWDLAVSPQARGLGLGHALVAWAQEGLRASGHHTLTFGTTEGNAPVHRLYEADSIRALELSSGGAWWPGLQG